MSPSKILFVCDGLPLSENFSGASSFKYSHLRLLLTSFPHATVQIVVLKFYEQDSFHATELQAEFPNANYSIQILDFRNSQVSNRTRQMHAFRLNLHAIRYFHHFINGHTIQQFSKIVEQFQPDLVWTEDYVPNYYALCAKFTAPLVYVHYDFIWKLQQIRHQNAGNRKKAVNWLRKTSEISQLRHNQYIVSGSQSEIGEIKRINPTAHTALLPTTYTSVDTGSNTVPSDTRIVHVGSMLATANKIGLSRFLTVCWPELCKLSNPPELWVIGNVQTGHANEVMQLLLQPNIKVLGHVDDLLSVLRPYDVHIIPYEHDTGTRTRIPLVLNNKQLLLSTRNASNGVKGLQDQKNCVLVDTLEEMTIQIKNILDAKKNYIKIADEGKALFESQYTAASQQELLRAFLNQIR